MMTHPMTSRCAVCGEEICYERPPHWTLKSRKEVMEEEQKREEKFRKEHGLKARKITPRVYKPKKRE